jgi:stringent starvation protein B
MTMQTSESTSTRPYLIRAIYEWCTDNGLTPHVSVTVDDNVQVPLEYVKDRQIVLNISLDATTALVLGNEYIEFKARFAGKAREILVPVNQVNAIYARENGQGMAFQIEPAKSMKLTDTATKNLISVPAGSAVTEFDVRNVKLAQVQSGSTDDDSNSLSEPPRPSANSARPTLTRIK